MLGVALCSLLLLECCVSTGWARVVGRPKDPSSGFSSSTTYQPRECTRRAQTGDLIKMHYSLRLDSRSGTEVENSHSRGHTLDFHLGLGEVPRGVDRGLRSACKGEKRAIKVPPQLGYGDAGRSGVPAGSALYYEVEVVDVELSGFKQWRKGNRPTVCARRVREGDQVEIRYNVTLLKEDSKEETPFESSSTHGETYTFWVGGDDDSKVLKGLEMGVLALCEGEGRRVVIPPLLATGTEGPGSRAPAGSTVAIELEVVAIVGGTLEWVRVSGPKCDRATRRGDTVIIYQHLFVEGSSHDKIRDEADTEPVTYNLGSRDVMEGLNKGLLGACIGERRRLYIPPEYSYTTQVGDVPAHVRLIVDIEIKDIEAPDLFKLCDGNKDGWISKAEFLKHMPNTEEFVDKSSEETKAILETRMIELDVDGNKYLCRHEFYKIPHHHRDEL